MRHRFQTLLFCLALMAVGAVQLFGMQAGYLCGCTGQEVTQAACEPEGCHPENPSTAEIRDSDPGKAIAPSPVGEQDPAPVDHSHKEIRTDLNATGFLPLHSLPPLVLYALPPALQTADCLLLDLSPLPGAEQTGPPGDGSPPMPLLVARTIVMLV